MEGNNGICGYVVAAPDANEFHGKMTLSWLPEMQQKYPVPVETDTTSLTAAQVQKLDRSVHYTVLIKFASEIEVSFLLSSKGVHVEAFLTL